MFVGGYCNEDIIESIGNYIDQIEEDDVVIIGWTDISIELDLLIQTKDGLL